MKSSNLKTDNFKKSRKGAKELSFATWRFCGRRTCYMGGAKTLSTFEAGIGMNVTGVKMIPIVGEMKQIAVQMSTIGAK